MVPGTQVEVSVFREGRMMFTKYSHLLDMELVSAVLNSNKSSELEMELANRLGDAAVQNEALTANLAHWNPYVRQKDGDKYVGNA